MDSYIPVITNCRVLIAIIVEIAYYSTVIGKQKAGKKKGKGVGRGKMLN